MQNQIAESCMQSR